MKQPPELPDLQLQDYDELTKVVDPKRSEWDRIHAILRNMFTALQDIQKTQLSQCEIAKQTCARLTILEGKIK